MTSFPLPARPQGCTAPAWDSSYADHAIEPKFNGWRMVIDQQERKVFNRHGERAKFERDILKTLGRTKIASRFLDCEWMGNRTRTGQNTLILIDVMEPLPYAERRKLFSKIKPASFEVPDNALLRMPTFRHNRLKAIWEEMEFQNRKAGETIFEGFVMKKDDRYPVLSNPKHSNFEWHKMKIRE
jgi:hypothetical protein